MKLNNIFILTLLLGVGFASCSDMDKVTSEGNRLTDAQLKEAATAVPSRISVGINGAYNSMQTPLAAFGTQGRADDLGYPMLCFAQDLNGADIVSPNTGYNWFSVNSAYQDRQPTYANPYARYYLPYRQIDLVNKVLVNIGETTDKELLESRGQMLALRAFSYLALIPYFQFNYSTSADKPAVPLVTEKTTNYTNNPRATVREVYTQILSDLKESRQLLDAFKRTNKMYVNKTVVYGLLARTYLYMNDFAQAAAYADSAITSFEGKPASAEEVSHPAFCNLAETNWIWGTNIDKTMVTGDASYATPAGQISSFSADGYPAQTQVYRMISKRLFDLIPTSDVRKGWWVDADLQSPLLDNLTWGTAADAPKGQAIASTSYKEEKLPFLPYTNVKFGMKSGIGSTTNDSDYPYMRVEEMYFIKAEGMARSGNLAGGKEVLVNFVQNYRDRDYVLTANDEASFINAVWLQRRIELWGEGFFISDAMRLNKPIVRFQQGIEDNWPNDFRFNIAPNDPYLLLRFPQSETNNNQGIPVTENQGGLQPVSGQNAELRDGVTD